MDSGISVLIPVYNGARYLSACVQSVRDQTCQPAEIVVIDDGSEDETPIVARSLGDAVRYLRLEHGGLPYARNHGLRLAKHPLIAFVDSDDLWLPEKLQLQMSVLAKEPEPVMVFGHVQQFVSEDLSAEEAAQLKCSDEPLPGRFSSTLLMRRTDIDRAGAFNEAIQTGEFIEWCSRAQDAGIKQIMLPEIVCRRRLHRSNMGRGGAALQTGYVRMLKTVLDRRRGLT